ncbi:MAG: hypothetical protein ACPG05_00470 [Bdellovibrionales bacterium]
MNNSTKRTLRNAGIIGGLSLIMAVAAYNLGDKDEKKAPPMPPSNLKIEIK